MQVEQPVERRPSRLGPGAAARLAQQAHGFGEEQIGRVVAVLHTLGRRRAQGLGPVIGIERAQTREIGLVLRRLPQPVLQRRFSLRIGRRRGGGRVRFGRDRLGGDDLGGGRRGRRRIARQEPDAHCGSDHRAERENGQTNLFRITPHATPLSELGAILARRGARRQCWPCGRASRGGGAENPKAAIDRRAPAAECGAQFDRASFTGKAG